MADEAFELSPRTRSRQTYNGFILHIEDDGEVLLWAETAAAQKMWMAIDENAQPRESFSGKSYVFCGYWRPPNVQSLQNAIDTLWDKHKDRT